MYVITNALIKKTVLLALVGRGALVLVGEGFRSLKFNRD
jgi:hypothetical protein